MDVDGCEKSGELETENTGLLGGGKGEMRAAVGPSSREENFRHLLLGK
jgi:hypothetical protein